MTTTTEDLNVSLESHLVEALRSLQGVASNEIADILSPYTTSLPPPTIPYSVLRSVSRWAQTADKTLRSHSPPLDPHAYSMIALLAGTTTSPERRLGTYVPPKDSEEIEAEKSAEKRSITALLNGLLSVLGSGFAVWWAADRLRWKNEWRVLLALFASIVVAVAEAVLYLIWQSRRSQSKSRRPKTAHARPKKDQHSGGSEINSDDKSTTISTSVKEMADSGLRRRQ